MLSLLLLGCIIIAWRRRRRTTAINQFNRRHCLFQARLKGNFPWEKEYSQKLEIAFSCKCLGPIWQFYNCFYFSKISWIRALVAIFQCPNAPYSFSAGNLTMFPDPVVGITDTPAHSAPGSASLGFTKVPKVRLSWINADWMNGFSFINCLMLVERIVCGSDTVVSSLMFVCLVWCDQNYSKDRRISRIFRRFPQSGATTHECPR